MDLKYRQVTIDQAIRKAFWMVKLPSMAALFAPLLAYLYLAKLGYLPTIGYAGMKWAVPTLLISFLGSWLVWSIQIPRWRLWAYRRVTDITELKRAAVEAQLIWSEDSGLNKTEIMSRSLRDELRRLEDASSRHQG